MGFCGLVQCHKKRYARVAGSRRVLKALELAQHRSHVRSAAVRALVPLSSYVANPAAADARGFQSLYPQNFSNATGSSQLTSRYRVHHSVANLPYSMATLSSRLRLCHAAGQILALVTLRLPLQGRRKLS